MTAAEALAQAIAGAKVKECGSRSSYSAKSEEHFVTIGVEVPRDRAQVVLRALQALATTTDAKGTAR